MNSDVGPCRVRFLASFIVVAGRTYLCVWLAYVHRTTYEPAKQRTVDGGIDEAVWRTAQL